MHSTKTILLMLSSIATMAAANSIRFYNSGGCDGFYTGCDVNARVCCAVNANAIAIDKNNGQVAVMYRGGACANSVCSAGGAGTFCCTGGGFTGGSFYNARKRGDKRSESEECTSRALPNIFGISVGSGEYLEITGADQKFNDLLETFKTVPAEKHVEWLEANGAQYVQPDGPVGITQTDFAALN